MNVVLLIFRKARLFTVDIGGQPHAVGHVGAPGIKVEERGALRSGRERAVRADYVVTLVLNPDAAKEAHIHHSFAGSALRRDIENNCADIAEELAAHELEIVAGAVETGRIHQDHGIKAICHVSIARSLGELAQGQGARCGSARAAEESALTLFFLGAQVVLAGEVEHVNFLVGQRKTAQVVPVVLRHFAERLVRLHLLQVCLNQRCVLPHGLYILHFARRHLIDHLVECRRRLGHRRLCGGIRLRESRGRYHACRKDD
jgi:hypothetical protein